MAVPSPVTMARVPLKRNQPTSELLTTTVDDGVGEAPVNRSISWPTARRASKEPSSAATCRSSRGRLSGALVSHAEAGPDSVKPKPTSTLRNRQIVSIAASGFGIYRRETPSSRAAAAD